MPVMDTGTCQKAVVSGMRFQKLKKRHCASMVSRSSTEPVGSPWNTQCWAPIQMLLSQCNSSHSHEWSTHSPLAAVAHAGMALKLRGRPSLQVTCRRCCAKRPHTSLGQTMGGWGGMVATAVPSRYALQLCGTALVHMARVGVGSGLLASCPRRVFMPAQPADVYSPKRVGSCLPHPEA